MKNYVYGSKYDAVSIILGLDLFKEHNFNKISENINKLNARKIHVYLQDKNFEDELVYAIDNCNSMRDLFDLFGCKSPSASEFKKCFLKVNNLCVKKLDIRFFRLYNRGSSHKELLMASIKK